MATETAWTVLLAAADTGSGGLKCPVAPVLQGFGRLAKPGAKRQTQEGVVGWPAFDPDFAEEPGLIEPYPSAIRVEPRVWGRAAPLGPPAASAGGLLGFRPDGFDLIHELHGIFARHAVVLEDGLDVRVDELHRGRLDLRRVKHGSKV